VTLLIDGVRKAGEVGLACGLLNGMNEKNVVPAPRTMEGQVEPRTMEGQVDSWRLGMSFNI